MELYKLRGRKIVEGRIVDTFFARDREGNLCMYPRDTAINLAKIANNATRVTNVYWEARLHSIN